MTPTPRPWHVNRKHPGKINGPENSPGVILDCDGQVEFTEGLANAAHIVHCVNSHDELTAFIVRWREVIAGHEKSAEGWAREFEEEARAVLKGCVATEPW